MKSLITILFSVLFLFINSMNAQTELFGISSEWDDSFKEWIIYTDDEDTEGELSKRWLSKNDWTEWDYEIGDESGKIKKKWPNDNSFWELRGNGEIVTMRTKWRGDITEWRISDGNETLTLRSKYKTHLEEWEVKEKKFGKFEMFTTYQFDVRDWDIIDELDEEISMSIKIAMVFIVMYHTIPKI